MHQCGSVLSFSTPAKSLGCSLDINPSSTSQEVCELHCLFTTLRKREGKASVGNVHAIAFSPVAKSSRYSWDTKPEISWSRISESVDGPRHKPLITNPGNCGWTPGHFQQAGFPCQMLLGCIWAATHLLPAVCYRHPLSSFGIWADCCTTTTR